MEYELYNVTDNELTHHGIKGMRWGIRRYQNKDGSLTPAGKKRYDAEMEKIKAETKKVRNQQRTAAKLSKLDAAKKKLDDLKKGKEEKKKDDGETDEQKRERILKNPNAKDVYENRHLFSNREVGELQLRLIQEENIKKLIPQEVDPRQAKADKFIKKVEDVTAKGLSLGKAYNLAATVYNAFSGTNSVSLPKLDLDSVNKGNKKDRQEEKKALKEASDKANKAKKEAEKADAAQDKADKAKADAAKAEKADAKAQAKAEKAAEKAQAKADKAAAKAEKAQNEANESATKAQNDTVNSKIDAYINALNRSSSNHSSGSSDVVYRVSGEGAVTGRHQKTTTGARLSGSEYDFGSPTQTSSGRSYVSSLSSLPAPTSSNTSAGKSYVEQNLGMNWRDMDWDDE